MGRVCISLLILLSLKMAALGQDTTVQQLLDQVGLKPRGDQRGQCDTVGFAVTAEQMDAVLKQCRTLAEPRMSAINEQYGWTAETPFSASVCPHDDYYYAGRLYPLLLSHIQARTVILFGVFHKARAFHCQDVLVFDAFRTWHGPYGPVRVSPLREEIIERLPPGDYLIDNQMQMVEHSVEAIVPFLQAYQPEVEIVSVLVPYMAWGRLDHLASDLAAALSAIMQEKNLRLGRDVSLICSADAIHYGDSGWGGFNYAPFGTDVLGYQQAVKRDVKLATKYLCGPIKREKLKGFLNSCVDPQDVKRYLITWCGRFSVPLGLNVASRLKEALEGRPLTGTLLDYGTSISEASLDVDDLSGLGPTAPNNLHHWVGYAAIGYR